jgi:hypothetical protein
VGPSQSAGLSKKHELTIRVKQVSSTNVFICDILLSKVDIRNINSTPYIHIAAVLAQTGMEINIDS